MKSCVLFTLLMLSFLFPAVAQITCPYEENDSKIDTTNAETYYPLKVGYEFEYASFEGGLYLEGIWKNTVLKDTLIDGETFFKIRNDYSKVVGDSMSGSGNSFFRYESNLHGVLRSWDPQGGVSESVRLHQNFSSCYIPEDNPLDLVISMAIRDTSLTVPDLNGFVFEPIRVDHGKLFTSNLTETIYVPGLGKVESKAEINNTRILTYARLDDRIVGKRAQDIFKTRTDLEEELSVGSHSLTLLVYPQPAVDVLFLRVYRRIPGSVGEIHLEVYDLTGRKVKHLRENVYSERTMSIDVSKLASGLYLLKIRDGTDGYETSFVFSKVQ